MTAYRLDARYPDGYAERRAADRDLEARATAEWVASYRRDHAANGPPRGLTAPQLRLLLLDLTPSVAA